MDSVAYKGWCPLQLGDKVELTNREVGTVVCIRTIQDLFLDENNLKQTRVWFEFYCPEIGKYQHINMLKQQWWTDKKGVIQTRIMNNS